MANIELESGNIQLPIEETFSTLLAKFKSMNWEIAYTDEFTLDNGLKVKEVFAITSAFGGANFLSVLQSGGRYVPFFIKLKEYNQNTTDITIATGGSEDMMWGDLGRNRGIIDKIIKILEED